MASPAYFAGKVFAVTGGAGGMGLHLARTLYAAGAKVSIADVTPQDKLDKIVSSIRQGNSSPTAGFRATSLDVRDVAAVDSWIHKTTEDFGAPLNGAANLAAVIGKWAFYHTIARQTQDDFQRVMDINVTGMMNCLRAEVNAMARDGTGSIVNCSSVCGRAGFRKMLPYVTSKHAIIGMTRAAAKDVAELGIRVNAIAPGAIETEFLTGLAQVKAQNEKEAVTEEQKKLLEGFEEGESMGQNKMWIDRNGTTSEITGLCEFLLGDKSTYTTGALYAADGGMIC